MDIQLNIDNYVNLLKTMEQEKKNIGQIISVVITTLKQGGMVFTCGNGGSAADADHLAAELVGRFQKERKSLPSISLCNGSSLMTCLGNDYGFNHLFSRQIDGLGKQNDLLICFSSSGNSHNIIEAIDVAKKKLMKTVAFLGKDGGDTKDKADYQIIVPSGSTPRIQEMHTFLLHLIAESIDESFA